MNQAVQPQLILGYGAVDPEYAFNKALTHTSIQKNLSHIMLIPCVGSENNGLMRARGIDPRVVDSWLTMLKPPNQRSAQLLCVGMEVGAAYNSMVEFVLSNPELSTWKYIVTLEEDNLPPAKGFNDLLEAIEEHEYDVLGGLYYVKGECGFPQIWGDPDDPIENYRPLLPRTPDSHGDDLIIPCRGTGMGFTAYRMDIFRKIKGPWFVTEVNESGPWTQDLNFFHQAELQGVKLKVGVHCGIRVGHLDVTTGNLW